jgi:hypothetical protein
MKLESEDDRQEWYEGYYICKKCGQRKTHRTEYSQLGLVTSDEVIDIDEDDG